MDRQNERTAVSGYGNGKYGGNLRMRKQKYYLYLTAEERRYIFNALLSRRNNRVAQGRYTNAVDEAMIKLQKQASAAGKIPAVFT